MEIINATYHLLHFEQRADILAAHQPQPPGLGPLSAMERRSVESVTPPVIPAPVERDLHDLSGHDDIVDAAAAVTEAELCWDRTWDRGEVTPAAARHSYLHPHQPRGDQERC